MQNIIIKKLEPVYGKDTKTVRTGTRVFGNIDKVNWMNVINPPLSKEEIQVFEDEMKTGFPEPYKYLLSLMNGSFLANLVRIAGQPKIGGLSDEEEYFQPFDLYSFQQLYASKKFLIHILSLQIQWIWAQYMLLAKRIEY
ncbi:SMI1/KNR4 family protein [Bacillus anthracis]|nr:SMI1/KNR4 family protein [Bacillus anthracis]